MVMYFTWPLNPTFGGITENSSRGVKEGHENSVGLLLRYK